MNYTKSQTRAIAASKPDVLVSAAAGSGKTRVLTERVELLVRGADMDVFERENRKTTDPGHMEDIRHMLLVTFTRAAASEMRTRIVQALGEAAKEEQDLAAAERLRAQSEAAAGADITTIHGFCRKVIAENYEAAGVSAGFAVLSESQAALMRSASVREVFDELYAAKDADARRLLARYGTAGDDAALLALVMSVHEQMMGNTDPGTWIRKSLEDPESYAERLYALRRQAALAQLGDLHAVVGRLAAEEAVDPIMRATKTVATDQAFLGTLEEWQRILEEESWPAGLPASILRTASGEKGAVQPVESLRERARSLYKKLRPLLSAPDRTADLADIRHTQADVSALVRIVELFEEKYAARKEAANRLDFADLEHRALRVLRERGGAYAQKYHYIFVDEYQDTNPVQEAILAAIHLGPAGQPLNHQFLVGDMKQSIYGFRFADPTIFDGKSRRYGQAEGPEASAQLIRMNDNFRSSPAVVAGVNALMGELMDEDLGDVAYTAEEQLVCGRTDVPPGACRILLAQPAGSQSGEKEQQGAEAKALAEAEMIAEQIEALHAAGRDYGDIAVLFRSRSSRLWSLASALEARGIPAASQSGRTSLYVEIEIFLNLLRLIVNERQDIPLLSVLRSFLFGFDERELSWIAEWGFDEVEEAADSPHRIKQAGAGQKDELPFFRRLAKFRREAPGVLFEGEEQELNRRVIAKVNRFDSELRSLRALGTDMSLVRLAEAAANHFGLPSYLLTRPNGTARRHMYEDLLGVMRDLQLLHGNSLLRVLDAVDELQQQGKLFGDGGRAVQLPGVVRLMTVHGSKGLEFPVVFLAGLDNVFSGKSRQGSVLRSDKFGITAKYVDPKNLEKRDTLEMQMVKEYLRQQQLSEELRLLYVAMTRPQEELYLCGVSADMEKDGERWEQVRGSRQQAESAFDWVMSAWLSLKDRGDAAADMFAGKEAPAAARLQEAPAAKTEFDWNAFVSSLALGTGKPALNALEPRVRIAAQQGVAKLSEQDFGETGKKADWRQQQVKPLRQQVQDIMGARWGTLLHRFLRYAVAHDMTPEQTLEAMTENQLLDAEEEKSLADALGGVQRFLDSDVYRRLRCSRRVLTEQRFTLLVDAQEIDPQAPPDAGRVQLRGIIDLAFLEEDGWVLIDYKTDRAEDVGLIADRYREQLAYYSRALSELTGIPVKERLLYLFARGSFLPVAQKSSVEAAIEEHVEKIEGGDKTADPQKSNPK